VRPALHVFGHVHWGAGTQPAFWDDCQLAYERIQKRPPRGLLGDLIPHRGWLDLFQLVVGGIQGVLWKWLMLGPGASSGSLMVNAAQMYGNTGKIKSRAICFKI